MAKLVSKVYGDALFEAALEDNRLSSLSDEVTAVKEIIAANDDLSKLMDHPQIDKEEKVRIIEEIFGGRVSAELVGLMRMIIEKNHYKELTLVFDYFLDRVKEYQNIGTAYVTSAFELSKEQKLAVEKRLLDTTRTLKRENYTSPDEMKKRFASLDRMKYREKWWVIDVGGGNLRVMFFADFERGKIFIKHITTHAEYDKLTDFYRRTKE